MNATTRILSLVVLAALAGPPDASTQDDELALWQIGVGAAAGAPQGSFRDAVSDTRWGGYGYFTRRVGESPYRLGIALGLLGNGSIDVITDRPGRRRGSLDATLTNGLYSGHFLARMQPVFGRVSPYVEAAIGLQTFETKIVLRDCYGPCTRPTRDRSDLAFSGGGGGGVAIRLKQEDGERGISAEIGARYLYGSDISYFVPDDLPELADGQDVVPLFSGTSLFLVTFGVVFDF